MTACHFSILLRLLANHLMMNLAFDFLVLIWKFLLAVKQLMNLQLFDVHDRIVRSKLFILVDCIFFHRHHFTVCKR
mgnify:CR=1 FL=1